MVLIFVSFLFIIGNVLVSSGLDLEWDQKFIGYSE